jgi:hypothetical protein
MTFVTIKNSQPDVYYAAMSNETLVSQELRGTGEDLQLPIDMTSLQGGEYDVLIKVSAPYCSGNFLEETARISLVAAGEIDAVKDAVICDAGTAVLEAHSDNAVTYNWYEGLQDETPIVGVDGPSFTTPNLSKTKTYYVAAVNAVGCEGDRKALVATVSHVEPVTISVEGQTLISSLASNIQWYRDDVLIDGATSPQIVATEPGVYLVVATSGGCTTAAAREMSITGLEYNLLLDTSIDLYPNPATENVTVMVKSGKSNLKAVLISAQGIELVAVPLEGDHNVKTGEISLVEYPAGMYIIRIIDGQKTVTRKLSIAK